MTDAQAIGLSIFVPMLLLWVAVMLTRRVDSTRPDYTAERHRKITHRGFKTRAGIRS